MFEAYLREEGINAVLLPALDFMLIDADNEPVLKFTEEKIELYPFAIRG
jgi:aspartate kinase